LVAYLSFIRIPIIAAGIYSIGYHQGVIESHRNPTKFQTAIVDSILLEETGHKDRNDVRVHILSEFDLQGPDAAIKIKMNRHYQVASVAKLIVDQARDYVDEELQRAKNAVRLEAMENNPSLFQQEDSSDKNNEDLKQTREDLLSELYEKDDKVKFFLEAKTRIDGDELNTEPWRFIFVEDAPINAFVTEIAPKRIFIMTSLLEFAQNIDEVAFVLAHEVSHLIYGHHSRSNDIELALKTAEIMLLTIDPTAGFLAFAFIAMLDVARKAISLSYSRDHEREADSLGIQLVARCKSFDIQAGSRFMYRLNALEKRDKVVKFGWLETHPPSLERSRNLHREGEQVRLCTQPDTKS
jgi:predicted Zn-dependent protease